MGCLPDAAAEYLSQGKMSGGCVERQRSLCALLALTAAGTCANTT